MSRNRITAGAATLLLSTMLFAGVAGAQSTGSNDSGGGSSCCSSTTDRPGGGGSTPTTTPAFEDVQGEEVVVETSTPETTETTETPGGAVEAESAVAAAPSGSLPFTGGDVAGLVLIGGAALGAGALMVRRSRTADNS